MNKTAVQKIKIGFVTFLIGTFPILTNSYAQTTTETLSDAQIAGVMKTVNDGEIKMGTLTGCYSDNQAVMTYGSMIVSDHTQSNADLMALAIASGVTPATSNTSQTLQANADQMLVALMPLSKVNFDVPFINAAVTTHQMALDIMNNELLPQVQDANLKAYLQKNQPIIQMHLQEALQLQTSLAAGTGTAPVTTMH